MTKDYQANLKRGLEYQDFISDMLRRDFGIVVGAYSSEKYQYEVGESASGIEIKYDSRFAETGNLYIETAEKSDEDNSEYVKSGIMRDDNSWLYLIGNYHEAFILSKKQLQSYCVASEKELAKRGIRRRVTKTSIGFTFPVAFIKKYLCLKHLKFCKW